MTEIRNGCLYLIEKWAVQIWSIELTLNFVWKEERMQVKHVQCCLKHIAPKLLRHISTGSKIRHIIALWSWVFLISHTNFSRKCERTNFPCYYQKYEKVGRMCTVIKSWILLFEALSLVYNWSWAYGKPLMNAVWKCFCHFLILFNADKLIQTFALITPFLHACHCESRSRTATRLRSASMALIYKKLVCLSNMNTISTQQVSMCLCAE